MPSLLDFPETQADNLAAQRLRTTMAAVRIAFVWFGVRKTLTPEQKSQAADTFGAAGEFVSAAKRVGPTAIPPSALAWLG